nr:chloroplast protein import component Tic100 [Passiflora contracta]
MPDDSSLIQPDDSESEQDEDPQADQEEEYESDDSSLTQPDDSESEKGEEPQADQEEEYELTQPDDSESEQGEDPQADQEEEYESDDSSLTQPDDSESEQGEDPQADQEEEYESDDSSLTQPDDSESEKGEEPQADQEEEYEDTVTVDVSDSFESESEYVSEYNPKSGESFDIEADKRDYLKIGLLPEDLEATADEPSKSDEELKETVEELKETVKELFQAWKSAQARVVEKKARGRHRSLEKRYDFPYDEEGWTEEDLKELWAYRPPGSDKMGWDPVFADEEDWNVFRKDIKDGRDPAIAPFYLPYRLPYPVIPPVRSMNEVKNAKSVIEELDRVEEFLYWASYCFEDGSTYEGTIWDDLAHGKGVFVSEDGLVRYEGEWFRQDMEGHGVVEVDIPDIEPLPGSKLEAKMHAEGKVFKRDFMSPDDRKWLAMDFEDHIALGDTMETPFYENEEWIKQFGRKPEKGRYRYAGEWKHSRMHGCGVYEVNDHTMFGRFYFGEYVDEDTDCNEDISMLHAGIAEVAAAKARMFAYKPDGMVREQSGPYTDPQHPYFYEEEDAWMAPGFINQFYEVPDYWKRYVHEADQEREMWLNSFYKAPLRLPMPAELQYWWENEEPPEFVVINKDPEPDPRDPSKLVYTEDPAIFHVPTRQIINYIEDEEYGIRLFWQPSLEKGEEPDPDKVKFLPLGFDEFFEKQEEVVQKENMFKRLLAPIGNAWSCAFANLEKWTKERKKIGEMRVKLLEKQLEVIEAELCLEEAMKELEQLLKKREKEEEKRETEDDVEMGLLEEKNTFGLPKQDEKPFVPGGEGREKDEEAGGEEEGGGEGEEEAGEKEEEDEEDEMEDDAPQSSFGSVTQDKDQKGNGPGNSPFSTCTLSLSSISLLSSVPRRLQQSLLTWKDRLWHGKPTYSLSVNGPIGVLGLLPDSVSFPTILSHNGRLRSKTQRDLNIQARSCVKRNVSQKHSMSRILPCSSSVSTKQSPKLLIRQSHTSSPAAQEMDLDSILSLHRPLHCLEPCTYNITCEPLSHQNLNRKIDAFV